MLSAQGVAVELERLIVSGEVGAGTRLPSERALAQRFGVGRPLVREALRGLAERGLIEISPGRGAYARAPRAGDAAHPLDSLYRRQGVTPREVIEARVMLETVAARLSAERASEPDLASLQHALLALDEADGLLERARWDVAFHALVAHASHNQVVETMFASISTLVLELTLRSLDDSRVAREGLPFHRQLLDALIRKDGNGAERAVVAHLEVAARLYGSDYDTSLDTLARSRLRHAFGAGASLDRALDLQAIQAAVDAALAAGS